MIRFILIFILVIGLYGKSKYSDKYPSFISKEDILLLKDLEIVSYRLNNLKLNKRHLDISKLYKFIKSHKILKQEYTRAKLYLNANAGFKKRGYGADETREYYKIELALKVPIIDKKTELEQIEKLQTYNLKILNVIRDYAETKTKLYVLKKELDFIQIKTRVIKGEMVSGFKYRDEYFKILDKLRDSKQEYLLLIDRYIYLREYLKDIVYNPKELEKLL
jgi:hypothetical protein